MQAFARIRTDDGRETVLSHGDVIGRLQTAALHLDDGRVSEAHAMVSLRAGQLRVIALRGAFAVKGSPVQEASLRPGLEIQLARGLFLEVLEVVLPEHLLGVRAETIPTQILPSVASFVADPELRVCAGWRDDAEAYVWCTGDLWSARVGDGPARPVAAGDTVSLGASELAFEAIPLSRAGQSPTEQGGVDAPLRLVAKFDTVSIHRENAVVTTLSGVLARIVSELVALGGPVSWSVLAEQIWPHQPEPDVLRARLDSNLSRLRRHLRASGVRSDLVRADGTGTIELLMYPHDVVDDRT